MPPDSFRVAIYLRDQSLRETASHVQHEDDDDSHSQVLDGIDDVEPSEEVSADLLDTPAKGSKAWVELATGILAAASRTSCMVIQPLTM